MTKPFWQSIPISINELPSRNAVIQNLVQRIRLGAHSAVNGDLRSAKTSMLKYLADPRNRVTLFGADGDRIVFNYVDCQTLPPDVDYRIFLQIILSPIIEGNSSESPHSAKEYLDKPYLFDEMLKQILPSNTIFVLMLDEFDVLLEHPSLKAQPFLFGWLRGFASWYPEPGFVLIISSHRLLTDMTQRMWMFGPYGSPPLNIFTEYWLGPLPQSDVYKALSYAEPRFSRRDCKYIFDISGGHPFLVDVAASALWQQTPRNSERYLLASETIYRNSEPYFLDKWQKWDDEVRKAVTAVALIQAPSLLKPRNFFTKEVVIDLADYNPELRLLCHTGEVEKDSGTPGGYKLRQGAMLWWLADKIFRSVRDKEDFESWLVKKERESSLSSAKLKEALTKATGVFGQLLEKGATTLIEAYVKSLFAP